MWYLFEHQLGHHGLALGFPSIDGCNAICLQTKSGLFGLHVLGAAAFNHISQAMEKRAAAFASFVANHPSGGEFLNLYSVCFHGKRGWEKGRTWKDEIKVYANALKYSGRISGFDLSTVPGWPNFGNASDSAYVEFRRVFDSVTILYKPWHSCVPSTEIKASAITDGVNYLGVDHKGVVSNKFWIDKAITSLATNGTGFVISPESLRLSFKHTSA